jgi:hypothetical protein
MPSTAINYFSYKPETKVLRVIFVSGTVYEYKTVPGGLFENMQASQSKGKFLNQNIKGKFPFEKIKSPGKNKRHPT